MDTEFKVNPDIEHMVATGPLPLHTAIMQRCDAWAEGCRTATISLKVNAYDEAERLTGRIHTLLREWMDADPDGNIDIFVSTRGDALHFHNTTVYDGVS